MILPRLPRWGQAEQRCGEMPGQTQKNDIRRKRQREFSGNPEKSIDFWGRGGVTERISFRACTETIDGKRVQLLDIYYSGVGILHELTPEEMEEAFQHNLAERSKEKTA